MRLAGGVGGALVGIGALLRDALLGLAILEAALALQILRLPLRIVLRGFALGGELALLLLERGLILRELLPVGLELRRLRFRVALRRALFEIAQFGQALFIRRREPAACRRVCRKRKGRRRGRESGAGAES